ncbi:carbamoyl-phosphate synthase (glutamine-hydrolyzing) large subunit, partial [Candidatus Bathyarchaeota archaeon]|nr:carbamoyl-phosphate synthase (glutamine-hydrolyzing) large subunit [Candidatus Bathyarchaeota archaeon]
AKRGILEKYDVKVLGTPIKAIEETEDRELFRRAMTRAGIPVPRSMSATSVEEALKISDELGFPVILRVAYTLGGKGSGVAHNRRELKEIVSRALAQSMITQVLVEEYIGKWKEIEYEVMRDSENNCLTVCNMENFDPMGVHTGDSVVVAPSQTLTNREYHLLRSASIKAVQSIGIIGECNIQWALHPRSEEYRAIEINARMSRSSALASKATGYPLAYIAAKLAIGYLLPELINKVTGITTACFEPALDYLVVKIPRWDLRKFRNVDPHLGPQMKSVGEVMAIGRTFEEALQKAVRMLDIGRMGVVGDDDEPEPLESLLDALENPTDERPFKVAKAIKMGVPIEKIYELSGIDPWFLYKIRNIVEMEKRLKTLRLSDKEAPEVIREAKRLGFSDAQIAKYLGVDEMEVRRFRKRFGIVPVVKQIDTLAAEWPAKTNYLYMTYSGDEDDIKFDSHGKKKVIVLGAGVFRIGSSVEFDWSGVNTIWALKRRGIDEAIMVNYNPETVSTDYDISDKLYFEELTFERVLDIYEKEKPLGVIVSVGGQIPNNLALKLSRAKVRLLGTSSRSIDLAEDRSKFSALLDDLGIPQPEWSKLTTIEDAERFAENIGYPVLIRPSYVLSGYAMRVAYNSRELRDYLELATKVSPEHPVVISKFIEGAKEVEVDGVSDGEDTLIGAIIEHVEQAGVHSGDAVMSIPPLTLSSKVIKKIEDYTRAIARALKIKGPFNIQYLVKNEEVSVIECNLRASRSLPYVSKTRGINLIEVATAVILGKSLKEIGILNPPPIQHVGVKVPQFSFMRLTGADPILGVEMLSTGEAACLGENFADAFLKALLSAEFKLPNDGGSVLITVGGERMKREVVPLAKTLERMGFKIYATEHTADVFRKAGLKSVTILHKVKNPEKKPNILDYLTNGRISLVINIPSGNSVEDEIREDEYTIRRLAVEFNIPVVTTLELASALVRAMKYKASSGTVIKSLNEYMDSLPFKLW